MEASLYSRHQTLFWLLVAKTCVMLALAWFLLTAPVSSTIAYTKQPAANPGLGWWAALFIVNAVLYAIGALWKHAYRFARWGLSMGTYLGAYWAIGFWYSYFHGLILGISAPLLWTLYALNCFILSKEPSINPMSIYSNVMGKVDGPKQ